MTALEAMAKQLERVLAELREVKWQQRVLIENLPGLQEVLHDEQAAAERARRKRHVAGQVERLRQELLRQRDEREQRKAG